MGDKKMKNLIFDWSGTLSNDFAELKKIICKIKNEG